MKKYTKKILNAYNSLHQYLLENHYKGYEFDDILDSDLIKFITGNNLFFQRVAIQIGRRSLINFRKIIGIRKLNSSKAFGFFVKGYLYCYLATKNSMYLDVAVKHLQWLENNYCNNFSGMSWGNAFDFASRGGYIPKDLPTIVWTAHISSSFDLAYTITKDERYKTVINKIAVFIIENIQRLEDNSGVCLGYVPGALSSIHNSNLLGATALLRAWNLTGNDDYLNLAKNAIQWSCVHINPDGGWFYGAEKKYRWIDNFHTSYVLDCLVASCNIAGEKVVCKKIIDDTYDFWINNFFTQNNIPKYYNNSLYPIDIQCASQAIESLANYSTRQPESIKMALKVAEWTIDNMQKRNGAFCFRKGRIFKNNLESIHWGQSTMLSALGSLLWHMGAE